MIKTIGLSAAAVAALLAVAPAFAKDVCLQNNRIETTRVIDSRTILATDKSKNAYTIHMNGTCVGLDKFSELLTFRPNTTLGCLKHGDSISFSLPGNPSQSARSITVHGAQSQIPCYVDTVTAGAPVEGGRS